MLGSLEKLTINKIVVIVSTTNCVKAKSGAFIAIKYNVTANQSFHSIPPSLVVDE